MANTTNYNWETPDDTDLVKDGAAAVRTLGSSIDTTTKALNPETTLGDIAYRSSTANTNTRLAIGTTGQVLTVAGGVPSWATPTTGDIEGVTAGTGISGGGTSGTVTITNSMATAIDAKGDLIVGTGADTFSRLAVGTNGHTLVADSSTATGLKWDAPASGGGMTLLSTTTLSGTSTDISITPTGYVDLKILIVDWHWTTGGDGNLSATLNSNTTAGVYNGVQTYWRSVDSNVGVIGASDTLISMSYYDWGQGNNNNVAVIDIWGVNETGAARAGSVSIHGKANSGNDMSQVNNFMFDSTDAISSIQIKSNRTFAGGTVKIYGVK